MEKNSAATDAGVGQASFITRVKLTVQAVRRAVQFGLIPGLILPFIFWISWSSTQSVDVAKNIVMSKFMSEGSHRRWFIRDADRQPRVVTVKRPDGVLVQNLSAAEFETLFKDDRQGFDNLIMCFWLALIFGGIGYASVWQYFVKIGRHQKANKRIQGALEKVDAKTLDKLVKEAGPTDYKIVDVAIPKDAPMRGMLFNGAQGSGKSLAMHDLIQQVLARKRKSIIYDSTGGYYRSYFREGIDVFFNPALIGSIPISLFVELKYSYNANTLSEAFLPPRPPGHAAGNNKFFEDAARAVFTVIVRRLAEKGAIDTRDIARAFLEMPAEEMAILVKNSVASSTIAGDSKQQRQGVLSSISMYLDGIAAVNPGAWSISEWLARDDDSCLYLVGTKDTRAMFAPMYRLILQMAFDSIAAKQQEVFFDRFWFFFDEIPTLGDIQVDKVLAELRKYGVCVAAGTQSDKQLTSEVGQDRAETIMNCFNTTLQLAINDPDSQDRAARRIGQMEMEVVSQNQALAVVEQRDGAGLVINENDRKWIVMPSTLGTLNPCVGYIKVPGHFPVAEVDFSSWLPNGKQAARLASFAPRIDLPARDNRFAISRRQLQAGETAFDGVIVEAQEMRDAATKEAEQRKQIQPEGPGSQNPENPVTAITMGFAPATDSGSDSPAAEQGKQGDLNMGF